jgi:hypothetical protein
MTDISTTTPNAIGRPSLRHMQLPKLAIGRAISEISNAIMQTFEMAYVAPFSCMQLKPSIVLDEDLDGRDPKW